MVEKSLLHQSVSAQPSPCAEKEEEKEVMGINNHLLSFDTTRIA
jgi:hypothetical protein